jgi:hypothetical protein
MRLAAFVAKYQLAIRGLLPQGEVLEGEVKEMPGPDQVNNGYRKG